MACFTNGFPGTSSFFRLEPTLLPDVQVILTVTVFYKKNHLISCNINIAALIDLETLLLGFKSECLTFRRFTCYKPMSHLHTGRLLHFSLSRGAFAAS